MLWTSEYIIYIFLGRLLHGPDPFTRQIIRIWAGRERVFNRPPRPSDPAQTTSAQSPNVVVIFENFTREVVSNEAKGLSDDGMN